MSDEHGPMEGLHSEVGDLRARLAEAEETLRAIRQGEVDALLIEDGSGERFYTLKSADAPYRALVEQMQEGAVTLNAGGGILYSNRCFAELVDTPLEQIIGASIEEFVDPADHAVLAALLTGGAGKLSSRLLHDGQFSIDVHLSISTVLLDEVEHRTLIVTDMRTLTRVQRESQSKDEFLAMLAHELRNPLGAIGGAVQVLGLYPMPQPGAARARDVIKRQVLNMARLVDDLLDVGRVVTGKIVLLRQRVDLAEIVRSCVTAMTSSLVPQRRVELTTERVWVEADSVRLEQIVGNLLSNSLKFTPPDKSVRVSVRAQGSEAVLQVSDEGTGIPLDVLPRIFDLFVQGAVTTDRSKGGLGIGLTLVRRLVDLHGGTITPESEGEGCGSTFTVRLPAVAVGPVAVVAGPRDRPGKAARVLLVDDHADAREMYVVVLQGDGHTVYEAGDGDEALALFAKEQPDIAIVDIGLPGMDGHEVARRIRASTAGHDVRLIALTGYGFPEDRERSRLAGFDRHLVKPVAPDDLRRALSELLRPGHER